MTTAKPFLRWLVVAFLVLVLDQASKLAILRYFVVGERLELTSFFNLILTYNSGAAFSFLAGSSGWQRWFFVILALGISVWILIILRKHGEQFLLSLALTLVMGGAIGNVVDRLFYGAVVDFLDFHYAAWHFPAFNVADSAITVGAALMILESFLSGRAKREPNPRETD
ncbi:MAG: Lipoprotein signal peptidase [Betaproteobacteria bacterium ADurb.Bin341]|nr:MAG: Lipoprotein signal peptidase [Betaproteobacteria bacterium ADurb.Bin341]